MAAFLSQNGSDILYPPPIRLYPTVFTAEIGPGMCQRHRPSGMDGSETFSQEPAVKHFPQQVKRIGKHLPVRHHAQTILPYDLDVRMIDRIKAFHHSFAR